MRCKHSLAIGLALALPLLGIHAQAQADGPIANLLHLHHGDCDARQSVVRLPAQEIRIETTQPRVIVNQGVGISRMRGGYMAAGSPAFMPMVQGPFVATVLPMQGMTMGATNCNGGGSGSPTLDAIQAMQVHHLNFAKQQASLQKEVEMTNQIAKQAADRLSATLKATSSGSSDPSDIQSQLTKINQRLDDIQNLLIIHDNILMKMNPTGASPKK